MQASPDSSRSSPSTQRSDAAGCEVGPSRWPASREPRSAACPTTRPDQTTSPSPAARPPVPNRPRRRRRPVRRRPVLRRRGTRRQQVGTPTPTAVRVLSVTSTGCATSTGPGLPGTVIRAGTHTRPRRGSCAGGTGTHGPTGPVPTSSRHRRGGTPIPTPSPCCAGGTGRHGPARPGPQVTMRRPAGTPTPTTLIASATGMAASGPVGRRPWCRATKPRRVPARR